MQDLSHQLATAFGLPVVTMAQSGKLAQSLGWRQFATVDHVRFEEAIT